MGKTQFSMDKRDSDPNFIFVVFMDFCLLIYYLQRLQIRQNSCQFFMVVHVLTVLSFIALQVKVGELETELVELNANNAKLQCSYNELVEYKLILQKVTLCCNVVLMDDRCYFSSLGFEKKSICKEVTYMITFGYSICSSMVRANLPYVYDHKSDTFDVVNTSLRRNETSFQHYNSTSLILYKPAKICLETHICLVK